MPPLRFFDIKIQGLRDAQGRFAKATAAVQGATRDEMRELGRRVVAALWDEAPEQTGRLKKGLRARTTVDSGSRMELRITSEAFYTPWVIHGRGPVVARRAKALRFVIDGKVIFRKRVGPSRPNPFHRRALAKLGDEPGKTAGRISRQIESAFSER